MIFLALRKLRNLSGFSIIDFAPRFTVYKMLTAVKRLSIFQWLRFSKFTKMRSSSDMENRFPFVIYPISQGED